MEEDEFLPIPAAKAGIAAAKTNSIKNFFIKVLYLMFIVKSKDEERKI